MKKIVSLVLCVSLIFTLALVSTAYSGENYIVFSNSSKTKIPTNQHIAGDSNGDGVVNLLDVMATFRYISGDITSSLRDSIDTNADGSVNLVDVLLILKHIVGENAGLGELVE